MTSQWWTPTSTTKVSHFISPVYINSSGLVRYGSVSTGKNWERYQNIRPKPSHCFGILPLWSQSYLSGPKGWSLKLGIAPLRKALHLYNTTHLRVWLLWRSNRNPDLPNQTALYGAVLIQTRHLHEKQRWALNVHIVNLTNDDCIDVWYFLFGSMLHLALPAFIILLFFLEMNCWYRRLGTFSLFGWCCRTSVKTWRCDSITRFL